MGSKAAARAIVLLVVASMVSLACGAGAPAPAASAAPATSATVPFTGGVSVRLPGDWISWDIQVNADTQAAFMANATYDRLVARAKDGSFVPYLASSWTTTPTSATFTLRKDATCSDGAPITPTLVASSFARMFDPKTPATLLRRIFGAGPHAVTANDSAGTVSFTFGTPEDNLLAGFDHYSAGIICPAGLKDPAKLVNEVFGSGPYTLGEAVRGSQATLKLRKDWKWGPQGSSAEALPETITFKVTANATTAANLMLTGGYDIARIDGPDVPRLLADKSLLVKEHSPFATFPMLFNQMPSRATADKVVREALMNAVDPKAWSQAAFDGRASVTASPAQLGVKCYDASVEKGGPPVDLGKAATVLRNGGYALTDGKLMKDGKQITLTIITSQAYYPRVAAEYLQAQFNKLGINTQIQDTDQPTYIVNLRGGAYDVAVVSTPSGTSQMSYIFGAYSGQDPPAGTNYARIADPAFLAALKAAPTDSTCNSWNQAQRLLLSNFNGYPMAAPIWTTFSKGIDMVINGAFIEFWSVRKLRA